ncbi:magnesium ion transporter [Mortierella polycephala]|uniref:Magnesium transporter n=1 Tax=Mortierella polycephala TaxID=41804 RepID=A0A9P6Q3Y0_9FUNG|nr:magnesium ion transporter [Mortierella polycephala]
MHFQPRCQRFTQTYTEPTIGAFDILFEDGTKDPAATLMKSLAAVPHYPFKDEIKLRCTELDADGRIFTSVGEFLKSEICQRQGLHIRDLGKLIGGFSINQMPVVIVRPEVILVSLGPHIRALIRSDHIIFFDSPDSKDCVEDSPFVKYLQGKLKMSTEEAGGQPFEFRALEAIFLSVVASLQVEMEVLVRIVSNLLADLESKVDPFKLKELLQYTKKVSRFESKTLLIRNVFAELLSQGKPRAMEAHDEIEILLEAYMKQVEEIANVTAIVKQQMSSTEDFVNVTLNVKRTQLLLFDLRVAMGTLGLSSGAIIAGLYGMNLQNYLEHDPYAFSIMSATVISVSAITFLACSFKLRMLARGTSWIS